MTPIDSIWTKITAEWTRDGYVDQHEDIMDDHPQVLMKLGEQTDWQGNIKKVLHFVGGPTGHESYYVEDMLNPIDGIKIYAPNTLCICGGTINSWPRCEVPTDQVLKFLEHLETHDESSN